MSAAPGEPRAFLYSNVTYSGDDCLIWPFGKFSNGYGLIKISGEGKGAHRLMCAMAHGEPPTPDHEAAHSCGNRPCINQKHLRWATSAENIADRGLHGRTRKGSAHPKTSLSEDDIRAIRDDVRLQRIVAAEYGISQVSVSQIRLRKTWSHLE